MTIFFLGFLRNFRIELFLRINIRNLIMETLIFGGLSSWACRDLENFKPCWDLCTLIFF